MAVRKSLYELSQEYEQALADLEDYLIENDTDVVPEEMFERLNINRDELAEKIVAYTGIIRQTKSDTLYIDGEIERLKFKKARMEKFMNTLTDLVGKALDFYGEPVVSKTGTSKSRKFKSPIISVTRVATQAVEIEDATQVPEQYKKAVITLADMTPAQMRTILAHLTKTDVRPVIKTTEEPSKTLIKAALDSGENVKGAALKDGFYLRIS